MSLYNMWWERVLDFIRENVQFLIAILVLIITSIPDGVILINKNSRQWLKQGIEGENKKLDPDEIKQMIFYWGMLACVRLFSFVIIMSIVLDKQYSYYTYLLPFAGMIGAGGILVKGGLKK